MLTPVAYGPCHPLLRLALAGTLMAVLASGCGSSPVPMPRRMVADPVTLPRGMDSLSFAATQDFGNVEADMIYESGIPRFGWAHGLSDRMTLTNLTWLSYAIREELDRGTGEGRAPFALAVSGGLLGVGLSSVQGFIAVPGVGITAIARQGRLRVAGSQTIASSLSAVAVLPSSRTQVDGMLQIVDRVALGIRVSVSYRPPLFDPLGTLRTSLGLRGEVRPRHWISLHLESTVVRSAIWEESGSEPLPPDAPIPPPPPRNVDWYYPIWLGAAFHW